MGLGSSLQLRYIGKVLKMMASHSQQWKKSTESPAEGYDSYGPLKINFIYNVYVEVLIISPQDVS